MAGQAAEFAYGSRGKGNLRFDQVLLKAEA
jgi:hypothetical protein